MRTDYLARLSRAAHWRLPRLEADEMVADYQELLAEAPRSEAELDRDLGSPVQAVRALGREKAYRVWLAVFTLLALALVLPVLSFFWPVWGALERYHIQLLYVLMAAGLGLSLVWFFWSDRARDRRPLPKGLLPLLVFLLAAGCGVTAFFWVYLIAVLNGGAIAAIPPGQTGPFISALFELLGALAALLGVLGLVRARLGDRRWRALYTLGLTAAAVSLFILSFLRSMSLDSTVPGWWLPYFWRSIALAAAGLAGTGVSLC